MIRLLLWIWQLPQNLLGLLLGLALKGRTKAVAHFRGVEYHIVRGFRGGLSLGSYVFLRKGYLEFPMLWEHEYGHTRQSAILGLLYLPVIGLPSLLWAALYRPEKGNYYDFYTERWADKLGGVKR